MTGSSRDDFAVKMGEPEERSPRSRCDLDQDTRRKTEEHAFSERVGRVEFENDFARKLSKLLGRSAMVSGVFGRWYLSSATISRLLSWLALTVTLLVAWSAAVAHERKGFVILPNSVPGLAGPAGGETNIAEILATHEQTGGTFGVWRYTANLLDGPPLHIHRAEDEF